MTKQTIDMSQFIPLRIDSPKEDWQAAVKLLNVDAMLIAFAEQYIRNATGDKNARVRIVRREKASDGAITIRDTQQRSG